MLTVSWEKEYIHKSVTFYSTYRNESKMCQTVCPDKAHLSKGMVASLAATNSLMAGTNVISNGLLIYGLIKTNQSRKSSIRFFMYLSISDVFVGLVLQPLVVISLFFYDKERQKCPIELATQFLGFIFPQFSGVQVMLIAMDRFFQMKFLRQRRAYIIRKHGMKLIVGNICLAITLATTSILASVNQRFYLFNMIVVTADLLILLMIFVFYTLTYCSVHCYVREAEKQDNKKETKPTTISSEVKINRTKSISTISRMKTESALARTMLFILTSLSICYFPYLTLGFTFSYFQYHQEDTTPTQEKVLSVLTWWSFGLLFLNSSINAVIFMSRNQEIMKLFRKITPMEQTLDSVTATKSSSSATVSETV